MVLGTFPRLSTRLNLSIVDVAAARNDFEFSLSLGILEFSKFGTMPWSSWVRLLMLATIVVNSVRVEEVPLPRVEEINDNCSDLGPKFSKHVVQ